MEYDNDRDSYAINVWTVIEILDLIPKEYQIETFKKIHEYNPELWQSICLKAFTQGKFFRCT